MSKHIQGTGGFMRSNAATRPNRSGWPQLASALAGLFFSQILIPPFSSAQEVTAALTGQVTDASHGAVIGAKGTATDIDRGVVRSTTTNGQGFYTLPRVPVGTYDLQVEHSGFQLATESNIVLDLNQTARRDFELVVGSVAQSVQVISSAPMLQTQSTQLGQVIDSRTSTDLPLATRNYVQLTLLAAGSINPNPATFKSG